MRYLTGNELRIMNNERDMLNGNFNRMCVTDDIEEFVKMQTFAISRISKILKICSERLIESGDNI